jgi:hypothetical protein
MRSITGKPVRGEESNKAKGLRKFTALPRYSAAMKLHGYLGLAIMIAAEILLFSGNKFVGHWFTPIVWSGYILLVDALVFKVTARSLLTTNRLDLLIIIFVSIAGWWLFEFYNAPRFWRNDLELWWHYHNLERNPYLRRFGYDWAFATIFPAIFLTARLFLAIAFRRTRRLAAMHLSKRSIYFLIIIGAVGTVAPLIFISEWWAPAVWLSFIFLLDPINYSRGWPSITGDLEQGNYQRLFALLTSGGLCGVLWEFWNFWALSKWTYTVPYLGSAKIFEMPVLGYLGFPPFAVECWVMYIFFASFLTQKPVQTKSIWIEIVP